MKQKVVKKYKTKQDSFYYKIDDNNFGINFPLGIKAEKFVKILNTYVQNIKTI